MVARRERTAGSENITRLAGRPAEPEFLCKLLATTPKGGIMRTAREKYGARDGNGCVCERITAFYLIRGNLWQQE